MKKFDPVRVQELALPLPLAELWQDLKAEVERLSDEVGLKIVGAILEGEVTQRVGAEYAAPEDVGSMSSKGGIGYSSDSFDGRV